MSTITTETRLRLINDLVDLGTVSSSDLFFIQKSLKSYKLSYSDLVAGLPDDNTIEVNSDKLSVNLDNIVDDTTIEVSNSDKLTIKGGGVDTQHLANNSVDFTKMQNISNLNVLGNVSGTSGDVQEVGVQTTITNTDTSIPTSGAVVDYVGTIPSIFTEFNDASFGASPVGNRVLLSVAHGLSQTPKIAVAYFKCIGATGSSNNFGYEKNDELIVANSQSDTGEGHTALIINSTNIKYRNVWSSLHYASTTGSNASFAPASYPANWQFRFKVFV
jgi:hypothetical protein